MGNFNRYEKLDMLGDLDEKYIKEADKYLVQPLLADGEVIRLAPERRKFSFKPFVAAAAGLAVLIGGTAALSGYLNRKPVTPPVDASDSSDDSGNSSDSNSDDFSIPIVIPDDEYLVKMMELYGANVNIDYVRDKLDITEMELPEDIAEAAGLPDSAPVIIGNSAIAISRVNEDGYPEIGMYSAAGGSGYYTMHSRSDDPQIDKNTKLKVLGFSDYVIIFEADFYHGTTVWKRELRTVEINPMVGGEGGGFGWRTWYTLKGSEVVDSRMVYSDTTLYFSVKENADDTSFNQQIHRSGDYDPIASGAGLYYFNCEIYYWYDESGDGTKLVLRSINGDMPIDIDKYGGKALTIGGSGIYDVGSTVTSCISGDVILSGGTMTDISAVPFGFGMIVGDENDRAVYNADTCELLVFAEDDELRTNLNWIGYDKGVCAYTADPGEPVRMWFITKKNVVHPRLDIRSIKNKYKIDMPLEYVEDNFDIVTYDIPETINGKFTQTRNNFVIDKERMIVMLGESASFDYGSHLFDFAVYNFTNGSYEMIYQPSSDKYVASRLEFVNSDYLVFSLFEQTEHYWSFPAEMYIIDLASGDYTPKLICTYTAASPQYHAENTVLLNGKLYFCDNNERGVIFCCDIMTGQLEKAVEGENDYLVPRIYNGTVVYEVRDYTKTFLRSIDGSIEFVGGPSGFWICKNDVFRLNDIYGAPTSVTTGKTLIAGGRFGSQSSCGNYINFSGSYNYQDDFIYDAVNNRMMIYKGDVECGHWLPDGTGVSIYYSGSPYKINIFTEK